MSVRGKTIRPLLVLTVLVWAASPVFAQHRVSLGKLIAEPGNNLSLPIYLSSTQKIGLIQFVVEYDSNKVRLLAPPVEIGPAAIGFQLSLVNRSLPFRPESSIANANILLQISGGGTASLSGDSLLAAFLNLRATGALGDTLKLALAKGTDRSFLTTTELLDISIPQLALRDGLVVLQDITRPQVSISTPPEGDTLRTNSTLITGFVTDGGGSGLRTVEVSTDGGASWQTVEQNGDTAGDWQFGWQDILPGNYTLRARARDGAGNIGVSPLGHFVFVELGAQITAVPTISKKRSGVGEVMIELVWQPSVGAVDTERKPVVEFLDSQGKGHLAQQTLFTDQGWVGLAEIDSSYADGFADLQVRGLLSKEGYIYSAVYLAEVLLVDVLPPEPFSAITPAHDTWIRHNRPTLVWQATSDRTSGLRGYAVFLDGVALGDDLSPETTQLAILIALAQGSHLWWVQAVDSVGNLQQTPVSRFGIDLTPPITTIDSPAAGADLVDQVLVQGKIFDTAGSEAGSGADSVFVSTDGGISWHLAEVYGSSGNLWRYLWTISESGSFSLQAFSVDKAGNRGAVSSPRIVTAVQDGGVILPTQITLRQNIPNPFTTETTIWLDVPTAAEVSLRIYNLLGQEVALLWQNFLPAGSHRFVWDGRQRNGAELPSGIYFVRVQSGAVVRMGRLVITR